MHLWKRSRAADCSSHEPEKAKAVLKKGDMQRMVDLGLGRGVDGTKPHPWSTKSSFQVHRVCTESVIGTEEGGLLQHYETEVTTVKTQQANLKAGVQSQTYVNIAVDGEFSHSHSHRMWKVGTKVVNRTVSFKADFQDVPYYHTNDSLLEPLDDKVLRQSLTYEKAISRQRTRLRSHTPCTTPTFEERLCMWLMDRVFHRWVEAAEKLSLEGKEVPKEMIFITGDPATDIANVIRTSSPKQEKKLVSDCVDFVQHFHITHYVSAIELGATEYFVSAESEYKTRLGASVALGAEAYANLGLKQSTSWKRSKKVSSVRKIGIIKNEAVKRGSYDEAVVGVSLQPITTLVRQCHLKKILKKAVCTYMEEQERELSKCIPYNYVCSLSHNYTVVLSINYYMY